MFEGWNRSQNQMTYQSQRFEGNSTESEATIYSTGNKIRVLIESTYSINESHHQLWNVSRVILIVNDHSEITLIT